MGRSNGYVNKVPENVNLENERETRVNKIMTDTFRLKKHNEVTSRMNF